MQSEDSGIAAIERIKREIETRPPLTDEEVERLRSMTPEQRLANAFDLNRQFRFRLADQVRLDNPNWSIERVSQEVGIIVLEGFSSPWSRPQTV